MSALYTAAATANGREGRAVSSDGQLDLTLAFPPALGGNGKGTNPEQLFAAGYAACFDSALSLVARMAKVETGVTRVTAHVGIGKNESGGFGLTVSLEVHVPGVALSVAEELVAKAHEVCPYSNATRGNVEVTLITSNA